MATLPMIKEAKGCDCAPSSDIICKINMLQRGCLRTKVVGTTCEDGIHKIEKYGGVVGLKPLYDISIEAIQLWSPVQECRGLMTGNTNEALLLAKPVECTTVSI
jgi:hypothetical protein